MSTLSMAAFGIITPFTARLHPFNAIQTQSWNIVYVPYCTGDVHTGNKVAVYPDADPAKPALTYYRSRLPLYSLAAAWDPTVDASGINDVDGLRFCDLPWITDCP